MKKHLFLTGSDPYTYSDYGYSDLTNHPKLQEGFEVIEGGVPEGAVKYVKKTTADLLNDIYNAQPAIKRGTYAPLKAAVDLLLEQGDIEAVQALVQGATVAPEDEPIKQQLLALLQ